MTIAKAPDSIFWCFLKAIINFLTKSNQLSPILYRITLTTSLFRISRHSLILRINCVFFILIHKRPLHFNRYSMLDLSPVIVENRINLVLNLIQFMLLIILMRLYCSQLLILLLIQLRLPIILNNNIIILLITSILIIVNLIILALPGCSLHNFKASLFAPHKHILRIGLKSILLRRDLWRNIWALVLCQRGVGRSNRVIGFSLKASNYFVELKDAEVAEEVWDEASGQQYLE